LEHKAKMWFAYFTSSSYKDEENFIPSERLVWSSQILSKSNEICTEVEMLLASKGFTPKGYFIEGLSKDNGWQTYSLKTWGIEVKKALKNMPILNDIIKGNSNIVSVSINVLNPGMEIKGHYGDSNTFYRSHFGIQIPEGLPNCGFMVNGESKAWELGKLLTFSDGNYHSAWNYSNEKRVIVVFDVIKSQYESHRRYICFRVRSFLILQLLFEKSDIIRKLPKWFHKIMVVLTALILFCIYPIQKITGTLKKHN
jgi:hypothetical protein